MVTDLVVVRVSKTKAAYDSLEESGVEEKDRKEDSKCERMVVLPDPLSPLKSESAVIPCITISRVTHKNTTAWFSARAPSRVKARRARSSASPAALPSFAPSGPFVAEVYVFSEINAWDERRAVGKPTWKLCWLTYGHVQSRSD